MSDDGSVYELPPYPDDDADGVRRLVITPAESVRGAAELLAEGFVALEGLTGMRSVVDAWPDLHRRALPETRAASLTDFDDDEIWFVRSPWPSISPADALAMVWAGLARVGTDSMPGDAIAVLHHAQAVSILGLDEVTALSFLRSLPHMAGWELSEG
jgi:hypothetical protein